MGISVDIHEKNLWMWMWIWMGNFTSTASLEVSEEVATQITKRVKVFRSRKHRQQKLRNIELGYSS